MRWNEAVFNKWAGYGLLLLFVFVLSTTAGWFLSFAGVKPNLAICAVTCTALLEGKRTGAVFGFVLGFLCDIMVGYIPGFYTFVFAAGGAFIGFLSEYYIRAVPLNAIMVTGLYSLCYNLLYMTIFFVLYSNLNPLHMLTEVVFPELLITWPFSIPIFYICRRIYAVARAGEQ